MNSINDALAYHWPFPLKHKKPAALKKQTAYRLGVKLPNELDLEIKALSKGSRHQKPFPRSTLNQKVAESRSIIDSFNPHSSLKHRHSGRALGAVPAAHNTDTTTRKSKLDDAATPNNEGSSEDCRLNLSQLRALFPPSTATKTSTATKLTQCDSPTFCPMNPYRMVYNSTLSSAHLLLNLKRQQELIDRLNNSSHQLKNQLTSLAVTSKKHESNLAKSEMTLTSSGHSRSNRHLNMPSALRSLCYTDRTPVNHNHSPPPPHPTLPQALGWRSKSEVLQLPEVDSTVNTTASEATVNVNNHETPIYTYMPRPSRRTTCRHHKKSEPAKYADPWKGGGRLYRKRLTDLATMVTETLIWEKSKQYKKTKGSSSALFSNTNY